MYCIIISWNINQQTEYRNYPAELLSITNISTIHSINDYVFSLSLFELCCNIVHEFTAGFPRMFAFKTIPVIMPTSFCSIVETQSLCTIIVIVVSILARIFCFLRTRVYNSDLYKHDSRVSLRILMEFQNVTNNTHDAYIKGTTWSRLKRSVHSVSQLTERFFVTFEIFKISRLSIITFLALVKTYLKDSIIASLRVTALISSYVALELSSLTTKRRNREKSARRFTQLWSSCS